MNRLPNDPSIITTNTPHAFRYFCQRVLPTVYDDSLSYYELLCKLVAKINEIISADDTRNNAITELQSLFVELKSYTDNYFKNMDMQEEINTKLNDMAQKGELATIISLYLNGINVYGFKTIADMKAANTIGIGSICKTLGDTDYTIGDGDYYFIRHVTTTDVIDEDNLIALTNNPEAVAVRIPNKALDDLVDTLSTTVNNVSTITNALGTLTNLSTTEKSNLVGAINETYGGIDTKIANTVGALTDLTTENKTSVVNAINGVNGMLTLTRGQLGSLSNLTTIHKSDLVSAITEVNDKIISVEQGGTGGTTATQARANLEVLKPYILFDNSNGTQSTVTLTETAEHFDYLDIYYRDNSSNYDSKRIYQPHGKGVLLNTVRQNAPNNKMWIKSARVSISGTSITWGTERGQTTLTPVAYSNNTYSGISFGTDPEIWIYCVVGYKH